MGFLCALKVGVSSTPIVEWSSPTSMGGWRTRPHDDGNGNPPAWPQEAFQGTLARPSADVAVYTSPAMPLKKLVFRPAPEAKFMCA